MANKLWIFLLLCTFQAHSQRVLLFANGYLGPDKDKIPRNNGVTMKPQGYWYSYDDTLVKRFHPTAALYVSGHHPMSTSMHRSKARFAASWLISKCLWVRSKKGFGLNTRPNPEGFNIRFENGKICGQNLLKLQPKKRKIKFLFSNLNPPWLPFKMSFVCLQAKLQS